MRKNYFSCNQIKLKQTCISNCKIENVQQFDTKGKLVKIKKIVMSFFFNYS